AAIARTKTDRARGAPGAVYATGRAMLSLWLRSVGPSEDGRSTFSEDAPDDDQGWRQGPGGEFPGSDLRRPEGAHQRRIVQGQEGRVLRGAGRLHPDLLAAPSALL